MGHKSFAKFEASDKLTHRQTDRFIFITKSTMSEVLCRDAATSPEPNSRSEVSPREKMSKSGLAQGKISITSCSVGDSVLVIWNVEHANYTILQETPTLYFLHSDCLDSLGLRPSSDGSPRKLYCTGEVVEKEYCHAKRSENRYRVPKGTKFYRVKVRPITYSKESMSRSCHRSSDLSMSQRTTDLTKSHTRRSLESSFTTSLMSQSMGIGDTKDHQEEDQEKLGVEVEVKEQSAIIG